jgi:hypothetical protein
MRKGFDKQDPFTTEDTEENTGNTKITVNGVTGRESVPPTFPERDHPQTNGFNRSIFYPSFFSSVSSVSSVVNAFLWRSVVKCLG